MTWYGTHCLFGRSSILLLRTLMPAACKHCLYVVRLPIRNYERFNRIGFCQNCGLYRGVRHRARLELYRKLLVTYSIEWTPFNGTTKILGTITSTKRPTMDEVTKKFGNMVGSYEFKEVK